MTPSFADARNITSGWECMRQGYDVQVEDPCDPWRRPMNYPSIWLLPGFFGWGQGATVPMGLAQAILLAWGLLALARPLGSWGGVYLLAAAVSPPVLLAVERGNSDTFVFAWLVAVGILAGSRVSRADGLSAALLVLAAISKWFPAAALLLLPARWGRRGWLLLGASLLVLAAYGLVSWHEIEKIARSVPRSDWISYGGLVVLAELGVMRRIGLGAAVAASVSFTAVCAGIAGAVRGVGRTVGDPREAAWFVAGASVYLCTWSFGTHFDYRLAFLLLTIPWLWNAARVSKGLLAGWARALLALLLVTLWGSGSRVLEVPLPADLASILLVPGLLLPVVGMLFPGRSVSTTTPAIAGP